VLQTLALGLVLTGGTLGAAPRSFATIHESKFELFVTDVEESERLEGLRAALDAAGYAPGAIALQCWGDRDFRVTDHDGYSLRIREGVPLPQSR
jgi:hypothetical protein